MPTEIKQGKQAKGAQSKRLAAQEKKTSRRVVAMTNVAITKAAHGQTGPKHIRGRTKPATPGEKARSKNLMRHGQQVPVRTKGKLDKKKRGF